MCLIDDVDLEPVSYYIPLPSGQTTSREVRSSHALLSAVPVRGYHVKVAQSRDPGGRLQGALASIRLAVRRILLVAFAIRTNAQHEVQRFYQSLYIPGRND